MIEHYTKKAEWNLDLRGGQTFFPFWPLPPPYRYSPLNVVFSSLVVNLCLSGFFQTVTKSNSQFKALLNAAIYAKTLSDCWKNTHTHTHNLNPGRQSKAAHKMPPVRQTQIQNGRQLDVRARVCVWEQSGVFCV